MEPCFQPINGFAGAFLQSPLGFGFTQVQLTNGAQQWVSAAAAERA